MPLGIRVSYHEAQLGGGGAYASTSSAPRRRPICPCAACYNQYGDNLPCQMARMPGLRLPDWKMPSFGSLRVLGGGGGNNNNNNSSNNSSSNSNSSCGNKKPSRRDAAASADPERRPLMLGAASRDSLDSRLSGSEAGSVLDDKL